MSILLGLNTGIGMAAQISSRKYSYLMNLCSIMAVKYITYTLLICVLHNIPGSTAAINNYCNFPKYLDTSVMWSTHNVKGTSIRGYFKGRFLKASQCTAGHENNCLQFQAKCVSKREDNKYQMQKTTLNTEPPKFYCMQILRRSDSIIQIRQSSEQPYLNQNACNDEHLILDNWPMMNMENFNKRKIPCPFTGGYNIRFHTSDKQPKCATEIIPTRLESECEAGDGMTIKFHSEDCMEPDLRMEREQPLYCAATWAHGNNTFVIVRPQSDEYEAWCMRIESTDMRNGIEKGQIFVDLVCDPGDGYGNLRETSNYLNIEFERRIISSTCADSYGFCDDMRLCQQETYSIHCRKFCGKCSGPQSSCNFPSQLGGYWVENDGIQKNIEVTSYELTISDKGQFECHEKDYDHDFANNTLLLQTFDNGCFPRYACFEVQKPTSSILEYRLGNRVSWPIKNWDNLKDEVCDDAMFSPSTADKEIYGKNIDEKPSKILVDSEYHFHIDCELEGWPWFRSSSQVFLQDGDCEYCLVHDHRRNNNDKIINQPLNNCTSSTKRKLHPKQYHCLGVFPQDEYTHAVVTRSLHTHQEYFCWVFRSNVEQRTDILGIINVLHATFCNSVAIESLKNGNLEPLRTYTIPTDRSCPYIHQENRHSTTPFYTVSRTSDYNGGKGYTNKPTWQPIRTQSTDVPYGTPKPRPRTPYYPTTEGPKTDNLSASGDSLFHLTNVYVCLLSFFCTFLLRT